MLRREFLAGMAATGLTGRLAELDAAGARLARAAHAQLGVTMGYDPAYSKIAYPNGDVPRTTGVCADVIVRAARDGLGLDLQALVHEDMAQEFAAYPARGKWGQTKPDTNIDHRRVPNLETFWQRNGAMVWVAKGSVAGNAFPAPLRVGDLLTWRLSGRLPHVGVVTAVGLLSTTLVHNIGGGVQENYLLSMREQRAFGLYRWPKV